MIENDRPRRLVISWASPDDAANPEKTSRVTFDIEPYKADAVKLTVTHSELEPNSGCCAAFPPAGRSSFGAQELPRNRLIDLIGATQREP